MFSTKCFSFKDRPSPNGRNLSVPKFSTSPKMGKSLVTGGGWGRAQAGAGERGPVGPWLRSGSAPAAQEQWAGGPPTDGGGSQPSMWAVHFPESSSSKAFPVCKTSRPSPSEADGRKKPLQPTRLAPVCREDAGVWPPPSSPSRVLPARHPRHPSLVRMGASGEVWTLRNRG